MATSPQAPHRVLCTPLSKGHLLIVAALTLGPANQGCGVKNFSMGEGLDCEKGTLACVCRDDGSCDAELECIRDRCAPKAEPDPDPDASTSAQKTTSAAAPTSAKSSSSKSASATQEESSSTQTPACTQDADCTQLDDPCHEGQCQGGTCVATAKADDTPCQAKDACITGGACQAGRCQGQSGRFLEESFEKGKGDWHVDSPVPQTSVWEVGSAKFSLCDKSDAGEDPTQDHSWSSDNMLAGTQLGNCLEGETARDWDCFVSPEMDISMFKGQLELSYWRHLHTPPSTIMGQRGAQHRVYAVLNSDNPIILEEGYKEGINDLVWTRQSHIFEAQADTLTVSFCVRTGKSPQAFAGWNLDDIHVRPRGCDEGL